MMVESTNHCTLVSKNERDQVNYKEINQNHIMVDHDIGIENLPEEIILHICKYLDIFTLKNLALSSVHFKNYIESALHQQLIVEHSICNLNPLDDILIALRSFNKFKVRDLKLLRVNKYSEEKLIEFCRHIDAHNLILFKSLNAQQLRIFIENLPSLKSIEILLCPYLNLDEFFNENVPENKVTELKILSQEIKVQTLSLIPHKFPWLENFSITEDCIDEGREVWENLVHAAVECGVVLDG